MSPNLLASLYMVLSMAGFTFNDALVKSLDGALPTAQVMAVRGSMLSILIGFALWQRGLLPRIGEALTPLVGFRAAMELGATLFFLTALVQLPLAEITAILQALPLVVALGAALFFNEAVGWRRWAAIGIGFIGVMIIIRPGSSAFEPASILMIFSVLFAAARDLATRALPQSLPSLMVTTATALLITVFGYLTVFIQDDWVSMQWQQLRTLSFAAMFLFVGYQCIILSMRTGDIAYVVPYRYTSLLWSIFLGYVFFAEVPDGYTIVGSIIVIAMGLFTLYRELLRSRLVRLSGED